MAKSDIDCLVILAGGRSQRMGRDKATVKIHGNRMIDHMIDRFQDCQLPIVLSASQNYGTGLEYVSDDPNAPQGPVGAITSLCEYFLERKPFVRGFFTVPIDAPYAPLDLLEKLGALRSCAIASSNDQLHPVFAYWDCKTVQSIDVTENYDSKNPSLRWLAKICGAKIVNWRNDSGFININTPEDLLAIDKAK